MAPGSTLKLVARYIFSLLSRFRIVFVCGNFWHLAAGNSILIVVVVVVSQVVVLMSRDKRFMAQQQHRT